ncbi:MAG TPA: AMIN domain-containing protein [Candidatus Eremiobacteraceae bacterium]|nr:AMIN domain-containing protein [Candidatus Eremiobacteraceae bacterium]
MKLTTSILAAALMTGAVWAQNPNIINNVQSKMTAIQQKQTDDSNAALGLSSAPTSTQATKPAAGAPASTVKPAPMPSAKPATAAQSGASASAKTATAATPKAAAATGSTPNNKLERVNVIRHADDIQIEIHSRDTVIARVSKLKSPERLLVELPATVVGTSQSKIPVDSAGVKGVRIAMNGKIPPTTSVVVDLDHTLSYELTPGPSDKFVLTLHTQAVAKATPPAAPVTTPAPQIQMKTAAAKPVVVPPAPPAATAKVGKPVVAPTVATAKPVVAPPVATTKAVKQTTAPAAPKVAVAAVPTSKAAAATVAANKGSAKPKHAAATKIAAEENSATPASAGVEAAKPAPKPEEKKWAMSGKRDPFFSPVVQQASGSGCSTGKKCLEIGQINVRGVVKSDGGFIAVVTNSMNKAYFLHENDPVFNGYVMRITGDSVVFQETVQDKLGKPFTREVTKRIVTPAV